MCLLFQQIFQIKYDKKEIKARKVHEHDAEQKAIMNSAVHPKEKSLAVGKENECHLLSVEIKKKSNTSKTSQAKKRVETSDDYDNEYQVSTLCSTMTVKCSTDDDESDFQKVVRFSHNGEFIVTGGSNGYVCILKVRRECLFIYLLLTYLFTYLFINCKCYCLYL